MPNDSFTTSWLAARLGDDPARIEVRRRAGELLGVPVSGGNDYVYPAWQFGADGGPIPALERILAAAGSVGMDARTLDSFMNRRVGTGGPKMWELARAGREDYVISSLRSAA